MDQIKKKKKIESHQKTEKTNKYVKKRLITKNTNNNNVTIMSFPAGTVKV